MQRRRFFEMAAGAIAAGALAGCATTAAPRHRASDRAHDRTTPRDLDAAQFHAQRRHAPTSFGRIAYLDRGEGDAALLLHGFPLNGFQWRGIVPRLEHARRCIAPDWLGLGYTEVAPGQSVAPPAQVGMLVALLDHLGIDRVDVIANDSGGAVAQLFATQHPSRVRTLLLTNCDVEPDSPPPALQPVLDAARRGRFALDTFPPQLADHGFARSEKGLGGLCYTYRTNPSDDAIRTYFEPLVATPERVRLTDAYALGLDPNPLAGITPRLRASTIPTRVVWGTGDDIFSADSPRYLDATMGRSLGVRYVPHAKLFFPEEFPDLIAEEALALWSRAR